VVSMIAVGGIVGLLLFNTSMQQASFAATSLQKQADVLLARQQTLQMQLDQLRDPQVVALKAQRMGMVLPTSPAVLDLRTGRVLGTPTAATRLDPLRLQAPPPPKPAALNPPAHVTVVQPPATHQHAGSGATHRHTGSTTARHHQGSGAHGRNHGFHTFHSTPSGNH